MRPFGSLRCYRRLFCAALTVLTLLLLTSLFEELPEATLAAVVIAAVIELVDVGALLPAWLTGYRREWLRPDVIAGLIV